MYLKEKNQLFDTALEEEKWHALDTNGFPIKQECIPVGCVPSAAVAVFTPVCQSFCSQGGGCLPGGGLSAQGGVSARGCLPRGYIPVCTGADTFCEQND